VLDVVHRGADGAPQVDRPVHPVPVVLDGHDGIDHVLVDLAVGHRLPVPAVVLEHGRVAGTGGIRHVHAVHVGEQVPVPVQDLGPLRQGLGRQRQRGELVGFVPDQDAGGGDDRYDHGRGEHPAHGGKGDEPP